MLGQFAFFFGAQLRQLPLGLQAGFGLGFLLGA